MHWIAKQTSDRRAATIDAQLRSGAGTARAHLSPEVTSYEGSWNWARHQAVCGASIPAGDSLDVLGFDVSAEAPANACKRCLNKARFA